MTLRPERVSHAGRMAIHLAVDVVWAASAGACERLPRRGLSVMAASRCLRQNVCPGEAL